MRTDLFLKNIKYSYKAGDEFSSSLDSTNLKEAVIALACSSGNVQYAIWSKKEIGMLWDDISAPPYTDLFTDELNGMRLWRLIQIHRAIEASLRPYQARSVQTPLRSIAVHGSSVISQLVFQKIGVKNEAATGTEIDVQTQSILDGVVRVMNEHYSDAMFGRLFYNLTKTRDIIAKTKQKLQTNVPSGQLQLL